eukprot:gene26922-29612_t
MTLEQLRIFAMVAERLHMTRAAEDLHITQSAASAAVAALEAQCGIKLFDRVGRGLRLSEAGAAFLPEARTVLAAAEAAARALDDLATLTRGTIAVAASQTISSYWLPARLARFAAAHPGIRLSLMAGNTAQVADAVLDGRADVGFVEGAVQHGTLVRRQVATDAMALFVAPGHPLAAAADVATLAAATWILREPGSGTRSALEEALTGRGLDPLRFRIMLELPSNEAVLSAVASGDAVTAVSELAAQPFVAAGRLVRVDFALPPRAFHLLLHPDRSRSRADQEHGDDQGGDEAGDQAEAMLDEVADRLAPTLQGPGKGVEADAAGGDGGGETDEEPPRRQREGLCLSLLHLSTAVEVQDAGGTRLELRVGLLDVRRQLQVGAL